GGEALDVRLVYHRVRPGPARRPVVTPVEGRVDDHGVHPSRLRRVSWGQRVRVRVSEQNGRVKSQPTAGVIRSGNPVAIPLTWADTGHAAAPHVLVRPHRFAAFSDAAAWRFLD